MKDFYGGRRGTDLGNEGSVVVVFFPFPTAQMFAAAIRRVGATKEKDARVHRTRFLAAGTIFLSLGPSGAPPPFFLCKQRPRSGT